MKITRFFLLALLLSLSAGLLISGCSASPDQPGEHPIAMASLNDMPQSVKDAPVKVQQAYQFALANPDVVKSIPCYCGCGAMGHTSNYSCYVQDQSPSEELAFDEHALGCGICVDITQDAMRLTKQGKGIDEIRGFIDSTYARYGTSNMDSE